MDLIMRHSMGGRGPTPGKIENFIGNKPSTPQGVSACAKCGGPDARGPICDECNEKERERLHNQKVAGNALEAADVLAKKVEARVVQTIVGMCTKCGARPRKLNAASELCTDCMRELGSQKAEDRDEPESEDEVEMDEDTRASPRAETDPDYLNRKFDEIDRDTSTLRQQVTYLNRQHVGFLQHNDEVNARIVSYETLKEQVCELFKSQIDITLKLQVLSDKADGLDKDSIQTNVQVMLDRTHAADAAKNLQDQIDEDKHSLVIINNRLRNDYRELAEGAEALGKRLDEQAKCNDHAYNGAIKRIDGVAHALEQRLDKVEKRQDLQAQTDLVTGVTLVKAHEASAKHIDQVASELERRMDKAESKIKCDNPLCTKHAVPNFHKCKSCQEQKDWDDFQDGQKVYDKDICIRCKKRPARIIGYCFNCTTDENNETLADEANESKQKTGMLARLDHLEKSIGDLRRMIHVDAKTTSEVMNSAFMEANTMIHKLKESVDVHAADLAYLGTETGKVAQEMDTLMKNQLVLQGDLKVHDGRINKLTDDTHALKNEVWAEIATIRTDVKRCDDVLDTYRDKINAMTRLEEAQGLDLEYLATRMDKMQAELLAMKDLVGKTLDQDQAEVSSSSESTMEAFNNRLVELDTVTTDILRGMASLALLVGALKGSQEKSTHALTVLINDNIARQLNATKDIRADELDAVKKELKTLSCTVLVDTSNLKNRIELLQAKALESDHRARVMAEDSTCVQCHELKHVGNFGTDSAVCKSCVVWCKYFKGLESALLKQIQELKNASSNDAALRLEEKKDRMGIAQMLRGEVDDIRADLVTWSNEIRADLRTIESELRTEIRNKLKQTAVPHN